MNMAEHLSTTCITCGEKSSLLSEYRDLSSWTKLLEAAQIRKHERISSVPIGENELTIFPVHYHRSCRSAFTHKKELSKPSVADGDHKLSQGKANKVYRQGDLQFFPTTVYFVKRRSTNQNHRPERKPEAVWNFEQTTE